MSKHIELNKIIPDDDSLYITKEILINNKKLTTPVKSLNLSKTNSKLLFNEKTKGINELYKRFTLNKDSKRNSIYNVIRFSDKLDQLNYELNSLIHKTNVDKEINILFIEYDDLRYPEKKPLEFILDTAYEYSDITPLPIIPKLPLRIDSENQFQKYTKFLDESIEIIETLNHKPIMGIVPPLLVYVSDLIDFYAKKEIDSFVFDFDGKTPLSMRQTIRSFMRSLKEHDLMENSFLHSINANQGRFNKNASVIGAKDILSFGLGFDSIGERHKPLKGPKEFFEKLQNREENKLRLFNKEDYGYYKLNPDQLRNIYPDDSIIKMGSFTDEILDIRNLQKSYNLEQMGLESIRLRDVINDQSALEYLSNKSQVKKEDFKKIAKLKKEIKRKQSNLLHF